MISFFVKDYIMSINTSNYLKSFFSAIAVNLEDNCWGSKYPVIMNELYSGKLCVEDLEKAKKELESISRGLKQLTSENAAGDQSQSFVSANGTDLIELFQTAIDDGISLRSEVYISISDDWNHKKDWRDFDEEELFKVKNDKFVLKGVRAHIRTEEELELIDKAKADEAFKTQKKKMDDFLFKKGFVKYKTSSYLRRNQIDVLEYIDLQTEHYGSKTFTVNYALIPLYTPHSFFYFDLTGRLGKLIRNMDTWWDYADQETAEISFRNVMDAMDIFLMPWFEERETKESLKEELLRENEIRASYGGNAEYYCYWLEALDSNDDFSDIICQNIVKFKLPKKLQ